VIELGYEQKRQKEVKNGQGYVEDDIDTGCPGSWRILDLSTLFKTEAGNSYRALLSAYSRQ
jgi:hypothetical protein